MPLLILILGVLVASAATAGDAASQLACHMFGKAELADSLAPYFDAYDVIVDPALVAAPLNLDSNPIARTYRTVLRRGMQSGANFAGHYALVVWGCGSSCSTFAVVDLRNGNVATVPKVLSVSGVHLSDDADEFLAEASHGEWGYRYQRSSNLLVLIGALNEADSRQGAFYYVFANNKFELIHETLFHPRC
jgi:hypothetical protein